MTTARGILRGLHCMARMEGGREANVLSLFGRILPLRAAWDGELFALPGGL